MVTVRDLYNYLGEFLKEYSGLCPVCIIDDNFLSTSVGGLAWGPQRTVVEDTETGETESKTKVVLMVVAVEPAIYMKEHSKEELADRINEAFHMKNAVEKISEELFKGLEEGKEKPELMEHIKKKMETLTGTKGVMITGGEDEHSDSEG